MKHLTPIVRGPFGIRVPHRLEATRASALNVHGKRDADLTAQSLPGTVERFNVQEPFRALRTHAGNRVKCATLRNQTGEGTPVVKKVVKPGMAPPVPLHSRQANVITADGRKVKG